MKISRPAKRFTTAPADVTAQVKRIESTPPDTLATVLKEIPHWPYPRGDFQAWIPVLDKFDDYLEGTINSYDLAKLQANDFTPRTKENVLEVLRFTRLLLENCTQRKLYSSYDRLYDLLLTNDVDVLIATLLVILRPAQQYGTATPFESGYMTKIRQRLTSIFRSWDVFQGRGHTLASIATSDSLELDDGFYHLHSSFYPLPPQNATSKRPKTQSLLRVDLGDVRTYDPASVSDKLQSVAEEHDMPPEEQFNVFNRTRLVLQSKKEARQALLTARLLALACLASLSHDDAMHTSVFLYEPELVPQLAELLRSNVPDMTVAAAILALDTCGKHRSKDQEVLSAVGYNTSHGTLMTQLRSLVSRLVGGESIINELVDAAFSFIAFIATAQGHGGSLISAGLMPLLLDVLKMKGERREAYIPRAAGLIDTLAMSGPTTLQVFNAADGVNILVSAAKAEAASLLEITFPSPSDTLSDDSIKLIAYQSMKAILRTLHRLLSQAGGTEGLRTLIDSDLPKVLKTMFEHSEKFGNKLFAIAINILAAFIHTEPTSLTLLQEMQLPQTLFATLEKGVPRSFEIMPTIPNAIGAICLNENGMNYTKEHPAVVQNLVKSAAETTVDENTLPHNGKEHPQVSLGKGLDELVRHHPPLRDIVVNAVMDALKQAMEEAKAFVPADDHKRDYDLNAGPNEPPPEDKPPETINEPLNKLMRIWKFDEGFFRNASVCKDFIKDGGLAILSQTPNLPCVPIMLRGSPWVSAFAEVFRAIGEHDHVQVVKHYVEIIQSTMADCTALWKDDATQNWEILERGEGDEALLHAFNRLRGLTLHLFLLSSNFMLLTFGHARVLTTLIQALGVSTGSTFVADLGRLDRVCFQQHARMKPVSRSEAPLEMGPAVAIGLDTDAKAQAAVRSETGASKIASRIHSLCCRALTCFIKLLWVKRSTDNTHRKEAQALSKVMAQIMIDNLAVEGSGAELVATGIALWFLFDARTFDGQFNAPLFIAFKELGGMQSLQTVATRIVERMDSVMVKADREPEEAAFATESMAAVRIALMALSPLVNRKAYEGTNSNSFQINMSNDKPFSVTQNLVEFRLSLAPLVTRIWDAPWLLECPQEMIKMASKTFLAILNGEADEKNDTRSDTHVHTPSPVPARRAPPTADPARVQQLVDMGFSRGAAEYALQRARNNVAAAADMILSMPHLFAEIPEPPNPAPEAETEGQEPAPENADPPTETAPTDGEPSSAPPNDKMEIDAPDPEAQRTDLTKWREETRPAVAQRALDLVDVADDLVFDLVSAFPKKQEGLSFIMSKTQPLWSPYEKERDDLLKRRLRLMAVFLRTGEPTRLESQLSPYIVDLFEGLPMDSTPRPVWTSVLLLFSESVFLLVESVREAKLGAEPSDVGRAILPLQPRIAPLGKMCVDILSDESSSREEIIAALRLLVILSRHQPLSGEYLVKACTPAKTPSDKFLGCHPYLALIARHGIEEDKTLRQTMQSEIQHWFSPSRNKVTDVTHFVKQLRQVAARDPTMFVQISEEQCELVDATPQTSVYHIRGKKEVSDTKTDTDVFEDVGSETMAVLLTQLGTAVKESQRDVTAEESSQVHSYIGFLLSIITELVGSYMPAKMSFRSAIRQSLSKSGLGGFITDLVCCVDLKQDLASGSRREAASQQRTNLSNWSMALLVALCSDVLPVDSKTPSEDMTTIRKSVLDTIIKALKDLGSDLGTRYARLWAISELIYRLLLAKPTVVSRDKEDSSIHMAKLMLEKGLVGLLATAVGEVQLDYPDVKVVLASALKTLECLTKISIKWGKVEKPKTEATGSQPQPVTDEESLDGSHVEMSSDDGPDLYRNSALGVIGGEIRDEEEDDDGEDDEEDDEMMDSFEDDETDDMDDVTDGGSEDEHDDDGMDEDEWTEDDDVEEPQIVLGHDPPEDGWDEGLHEEQDDDSEDGDDGVLFEGAEEMYDGEDPMEMLGGMPMGIPMGEMDMAAMDMEMEMDMGMDMDEDDMEEEDYDEETFLEPLPDPAHFFGGMREPSGPSPTEVPGHWGWDDASQSRHGRGRMSRLLDTDLLVDPDRARPGSAPASHPLVTETTQGPIRRQLPRNLMESLQSMLRSTAMPSGPSQMLEIIERLMARLNQQVTHNMQIRVSSEANGSIGLAIGDQSYNLGPSSPTAPEVAIEELTTEYVPKPTMHRWQDEMSVIPGSPTLMTSRLVNHIVNRLLPEARRRAEQEAAVLKAAEEEAAKEAAKRAEEEAVKKAEEDARKAEEEAKKAEEDRQRLEAEASTAAAVALPESRASPAPEVEMAEPILARTIIQIRGEDVDITDTGIDLEFLQALPDDMRADVVEQHMREQNRLSRPQNPEQQAAEAASAISAEFLDALPPNIRAEVVMQQAMENARRPEAEAPRPPRDPLGGLPGGFLDALSSELRNMVGPGASIIPALPPPVEPTKTPREVVQLLDKPGVAALVRLLFFPESFKKNHLFRVLTNLCANSVTRAELLNLLLSVVQDGSGDLPIVDKSFQQMSIKPATPKATKKPEPTTPGTVFERLQQDNIPTFIAQRCFEALSFIVQAYSPAVTYFLTEHEQPVGLKKPSKKGKGKEKVLPQTKFPIVILLGLLDRVALLKTPGMMESLTALLATITKPLATLKTEVKSKEAPAPVVPVAPTEPPASVTETPAPVPATEAPPAQPPTVSPLSFPNIPASVLKLVVNCLTVGECTSRNFGQTLSVMQNLSVMPDAKATTLQELGAACRMTGQEITVELDALFRDLENQVDPLSWASFSSPAANQAQLLRLLKTIEYLHLQKVDTDPPGEEMTEQEKELGRVYQSFELDGLWSRLAQCLTLVRDREDTDQIALVLLPLVEALMVVCKYRGQPPREVRSPSLPPASATIDLSDLFVSFTTAHRKILNVIVRNNPSLLSGSFSLLIRNPKVLEFENKRSWFMQKLRRKRSEGHSGTLHLNVRRQYVFEDSFQALRQRTGDEVKFGKLSVKFYNEDGIDAGGVTREWFTVLAQQIFDPNFALFEPCAADQQTYQPNKHSSVHDLHLAYYKFVGRVIGKAVYDGRLLDAYFNRAFYKQILGREVDMRDLESIDPEYHKSLQWMLDNDITGIIDQEFTIEDDQFGEKKQVELKENGANIPVTEENKEEYIRLVVSYRLQNSIKDQLKAFLEGFYDIIPRNLVQIFEPDQLELLISGMSMVDVDELKNATQYAGYKSSDPEIAWFWRALRSFSQEERSRFLMFVTSSSRVPLGGFTQLVGASGIQPFQIQKLYAKPGSLPQASTCFNLLLMPPYESYEQLREKLVLAVEEGGGFGKA